MYVIDYKLLSKLYLGWEAVGSENSCSFMSSSREASSERAEARRMCRI